MNGLILKIISTVVIVFFYSLANCENKLPNDYFQYQEASKITLKRLDDYKKKANCKSTDKDCVFTAKRINIKDVYNGYLYDTGIFFKPDKYKLIFIGTPASYLVCKGDNSFIEEPPINEIAGEGTLQVSKLHSERKLLLAYYRPDKQTYEPLPPLTNEFVDIILVKNEVFDSSPIETTKNIIKQMMYNELSKQRYDERIIINKDQIKIEPLKKIPHPKFDRAFYVFLTCLYVMGLVIFSKNKKNSFNEGPLPNNTMRALYKKGNRSFPCFNCGKKLKVYGKFECRSGHVPNKDIIIFKGCHICTDIHDKIKCDNCGHVHSLDVADYNLEEIQNREKQYISRDHPFRHILPVFMQLTGCLFVSAIGYAFIFNKVERDSQNVNIYEYLYGTNIFFNNLQSGDFNGFICFWTLIIVIVFVIVGTRKKILIINPYRRARY